MNFLESTNFFVRTIMFDFVNRNEDVKLKFRLAPMIHIGTIDYYRNVLAYLQECDEIFYEGVNLPQSRFITSQYKYIAEKLNLVTQSKHFELRQLKGKLVHSDFDKKNGQNAWKALRFREKFKLIFVRPIRLFVDSQILTREVLAKAFMTSNRELYLAYGPLPDEKGTVANLIMNEREQIVFKNIREKINKESSEEKMIGIIYGAAHMNTIARFLIDRYNYVPRNGKFMKVFDVI